MNFIFSLIVYFDVNCTMPAVKVSDYTQRNFKVDRSVNVIDYYKLVNGKCKRFIGDENLYIIKKVIV